PITTCSNPSTGSTRLSPTGTHTNASTTSGSSDAASSSPGTARSSATRSTGPRASYWTANQRGHSGERRCRTRSRRSTPSGRVRRGHLPPEDASRAQAASPVEVEGLAREVVGAFRGEEHDERSGVLFRVAEPTERDVGERVLVVLRVRVEELLRAFGEHAGDDAVDRDVVGCPLASGGAGEGAIGFLGGVVADHPPIADGPGLRREGDGGALG